MELFFSDYTLHLISWFVVFLGITVIGIWLKGRVHRDPLTHNRRWFEVEYGKFLVILTLALSGFAFAQPSTGSHPEVAKENDLELKENSFGNYPVMVDEHGTIWTWSDRPELK